MIHTKLPRTTGRRPTARRVDAAEKHLAQERDRYALFAEEVAAEQPTAVERVEGFDAGFEAWWQEHRLKHAQLWRKARALFHALPTEQRRAADSYWRRRVYPLDPIYLIALVRRIADGSFDVVKEDAEIDRLRRLGEAHRKGIVP